MTETSTKSQIRTSEGRLFLQVSPDGKTWTDITKEVTFSDPRDFFNINLFIETARRKETQYGHYQYRVVNDLGAVYAHFADPYERIQINLCQSGDVWLEKIRSTYGVSEEQFSHACIQWLKKQTEQK